MDISYLQKKKLPDAPGVYFFLGKNTKIIYIGKATSLKDRVKSYFSKDLLVSRSPLIVQMVEEAKTIDFREASSVLEALLLEADLIKKFKPIYNTKEKDDKSFNCVVITDEDFPQILLIRKKDVDQNQKSKIKDQKLNSKVESIKIKKVFGPFPSGSQLKEALKIVRKIFPYRDEKCKLNSNRGCFNFSIGLCPGTCIGAVDKKAYAKTIKQIELFLSGNIKSLVKALEKEMNSLAKVKKFEEAKKIRDKIYALQHINDISLIKSDLLSSNVSNSSSIFRIESYDIAHMSGKDMVGVMTVVTDEEADKSQYKKFNIKTVSSSNDTGALKEVLERRFNHPEWQLPNLIVVDGGIAQLNIAKLVLENSGMNIPVVSVVKDDRHKPKGFFGNEELAKKYKKQILLANSESHRFAIGFHKKVRGRNFLV